MATYSSSEKPPGMDEELALSHRAPANGGGSGLATYPENLPEHNHRHSLTTAPRAAWDRFNGYGRKRVGAMQSVRAVILSSCISFPSSSVVPRTYFLSPDLNVLLVFLPVAWVSHFEHWGEKTTFGCECRPPRRCVLLTSLFSPVCFLSIIPLEKLFDWCGEQMALFLGSSLGDLLAITLNNTVEATLAIILLLKCE